MEYEFAHEQLEVYQLALEVSRWLETVDFPPGSAWLRDQASRAMGSVLLNIAEGRSRTGNARRNHYEIAAASAAETCAALDVRKLLDGPANQQKLRRIGAMLSRLRR